jgi:D-cysteine desulfhydrase
LTAAAGARLGLNVVLVLTGTRDGPGGGNLALNGLLGATVVWAGDVAHGDLEAIASEVVAQLRAGGARPVLIPYGGSSVLGARGYVQGGLELLEQAPDLTTVVTAVGSGGTMAGLVHALGAGRVLGVDCGAVSQPALAVAELVAALSGAPPDPDALRLREDQVGAGYAELTEPVLSALTLAARTEGLILDPIYTGRALAGLIGAAADGQIRAGQRTVLLDSGGLPGLFGHPPTLARSSAALIEFPPPPN